VAAAPAAAPAEAEAELKDSHELRALPEGATCKGLGSQAAGS
jgi:hypothetical protein